MKVSIIVPAYNEVENIPFLIQAFDDFIQEHQDYEVIISDDGSTDGTQVLLNDLKRAYLRVVRHKRNLGKTQAIISGSRAARSDVVVVYDADMQFDMLDIPRLVALIEQGADVATGWKQGRYEKKFVSSIYNWCGRRLFRLGVHDMNAMKAMRKEVLDVIPLRKDWHRFIVPLASEHGFKIAETKVNLRPRIRGSAKYQQKSRIVIGLFDLLAVKFQLTFMQKPLLYFGTTGMSFIMLGVLVGIVSIVLRLLGYGFRPLLYLVILLIVVGILFFALGLIGESIRSIIDRLEKREFLDKT